jgi:hypothetical protein
MRTSVVGSRGSRWRAAFAALAVLGGTLVATVVTAAPAQARCNGVSSPVTMVLRNSAGNAIAREIPSAGTCNGNLTYSGAVEDSRTDGSCAELHIADDSGSPTFRVVRECVTGGRESFSEGEADGHLWFGLHAGGYQVGRSNFGF